MRCLTVKRQMTNADVSTFFQQMSNIVLTFQVVGSKGVRLLMSNIYIYIYRTLFTSNCPPL